MVILNGNNISQMTVFTIFLSYN